MADADRAGERLDLQPRFNQRVTSVTQDGAGWITRTPDAEYRSRFVVIATGYARQPNMPSFQTSAPT